MSTNINLTFPSGEVVNLTLEQVKALSQLSNEWLERYYDLLVDYTPDEGDKSFAEEVRVLAELLDEALAV